MFHYKYLHHLLFKLSWNTKLIQWDCPHKVIEFPLSLFHSLSLSLSLSINLSICLYLYKLCLLINTLVCIYTNTNTCIHTSIYIKLCWLHKVARISLVIHPNHPSLFLTASSVCTELIYVRPCHSANTGMSMCMSP